MVPHGRKSARKITGAYSISLETIKKEWCPWSDSNQHEFPHLILSQARLPISPQGHTQKAIKDLP